MKYSKLPRLLVTQNLQLGNIIELEGQAYHYLKNVMRLKDKDVLRVFNERDGEFNAIIQHLKKTSNIVIGEFIREAEKQNFEITLAPCIIKPDNFALILNMATQLGCSIIQPIVSQYTQNKQINLERFERIILEATEQSERFIVPKLKHPIALKDLISNLGDKLLIWGNEQAIESQLLKKLTINANNIVLLTGPEGGFAEEEIKLLLGAPNCYGVSLGANILRAETANITLLNQALYYLND